MKPLTIEQLKALEVGDWVWYVDLRDKNAFYLKKNGMIPSSLCVFLGRNTYYSDYGTKWLAYKNKEQAEAEGELVELKCKVGDPIYTVYLDDDNEFKIAETVCIGFNIRKDYIEIITNFCCYDPYRYGKFTDKSEAEARLKELQEEP